MKFKPIENFPTYWITDTGEIYRERKNTLDPLTGKKIKSKNILILKNIKSYIDSTGYRIVNLYAEGIMYAKKVHHLVLDAFRRKRLGNEECRHLDGDRTNNNIDNIIWGTKKQNGEDRTKHGRTNIGEKCKRHKLKASDISNIRTLFEHESLSEQAIADLYGVHQTTINRVISNKTWKHVGKTGV